MNLDTSINSPDMCKKFKCKIGPSDEEACTVGIPYTIFLSLKLSFDY